MGMLELGAEAFASERAMLRSMLGVEGCAALGEVREAAARRLDQFVMEYCDGPTRTAQNGSAMAAAGINSSQLQVADREGDGASKEWRGGRGGEEERWGRADEARGRREDRCRTDDRARGDERGRPTRSRSRSRSRSRERASAPLDRGGFDPRSQPNGGGSASAAASVIKPGDWARLRSKTRAKSLRLPRAALHHKGPPCAWRLAEGAPRPRLRYRPRKRPCSDLAPAAQHAYVCT